MSHHKVYVDIMDYYALATKRKCHFDEIVVIGYTGNCRHDNLRCSQWQQLRHNDTYVSVMTQQIISGYGVRYVSNYSYRNTKCQFAYMFWICGCWLAIVSCGSDVTRNHSGQGLIHGDIIKWKHFPRCWSFVRGIPPHKGQWRGALMCSLISAWKNGWVNNRDAGDLRHHRAYYDVTVMTQGLIRGEYLQCVTYDLL